MSRSIFIICRFPPSPELSIYSCFFTNEQIGVTNPPFDNACACRRLCIKSCINTTPGEDSKCPILLQRAVSSFLLILGMGQTQVHYVLSWWWTHGSNMKFIVLSKLLFWLLLICQVAGWEQVRQFPSAEETLKSLCGLRIATELHKPSLELLQPSSIH